MASQCAAKPCGSSLVEKNTHGVAVVSHYNVAPVIDVFGGVSGRDLGGVLRDVRPILQEAKKELPRGSHIILRRQAMLL